MKEPNKCENITEIRKAIDKIDKEIIALIGKRYLYVKNAAKFKKDKQDVKAKNRVTGMLKKRRALAKQNGLNPNFIEELFKNIVSYFINKEITEWEQK
ncbi:MAG: isochorismate-pyruvate lyase [Bacteroidetes bacterium]|nr:isochorismate-pyruvate lyase [Bacteroidota bacterium]